MKKTIYIILIALILGSLLFIGNDKYKWIKFNNSNDNVNDKDSNNEKSVFDVMTTTEINSIIISYNSYNKNQYINSAIYSKDDNRMEVLFLSPLEEETNHAYIITIDKDLKVLSQTVYVLNGYLKTGDIHIEFNDYSKSDYVVFFKEVVTNDNTHAEIISISKEDINKLKILQSYDGITMDQSAIPVIIESSIGMYANYIYYQDVDEYYKAEDIGTGEIYKTDDVISTLLSDFSIIYSEKDADEKYIYILKYKSDGRILAFDMEQKKFITINE
jgi:hypothetical protein